MSHSGDPRAEKCSLKHKQQDPLKPDHCYHRHPLPLTQMGLQGYVRSIICHFNCQICGEGAEEPRRTSAVVSGHQAACHTERISNKKDLDKPARRTDQDQHKYAGTPSSIPEPQSNSRSTDDAPPPLPPRLPLPKDESRSCNSTRQHQDEEQEADLVKVRRPAGRSLKRMSTDWESQLQDEPLYQTYRTAVITKEIKQQTVYCPNGLGADDPSQRWSRGDGKTLWQELPTVRKSGVLTHLSPGECKHQESMFEVLTSEASYLRSLRVLIEHFMESRDLDETLVIRDRKTLFSNIVRVREVSKRFLSDLEERVDEGPVITDICDIIHQHALHGFPVYVDYVRNQAYQEKIYTYLLQRNAQFAAVMSRLQESACCQRLPFVSFLLLPFQRITRIKMLTENILKRTKEGSKQERTASEALACVSKIVKECNTQVGKMKQMEELIHMAKSLDFNKLRAVPVISQARYLEKRGELQELSKGGTIFSLRSKFVSICLFLFNDLLIITNKRSNSTDRYSVIDHAHRSLVQVQSVNKDRQRSTLKNSFFLILLENHKGQTIKRFMKAPTESDMHRWMAAFPNPTTPKQEEEVIYEDWDCPQVQCVDQYTAQQADELNLEPTDIINVLRKTNEGWYEGIRLSDGESGWFPSANVQEITNEHVRRRNLREQYRVAQARVQGATLQRHNCGNQEVGAGQGIHETTVPDGLHGAGCGSRCQF
ncbi:rho guanine nucleotide exchange factor 15 [Brienomyrus brachyistius]|uniref:rho guanine nucleotide exchange factor 15 n=1 Tax=Brienomyrus brachyistius TaxID=42636 RepID=UPI0020B3A20A|nr:rho guanine nucleotide exchange factor 15 [Brienomyrus brachyistius]